ncbi:TlpA family protein disulfide reductase [Chitinophaga rhizosphaerae]|uniref:TlpA family protein disulfide reductase n=1 Tax=Chitinophaga rhizosphaerae TaxID=1864947 RepID=UPI000F80C3BC|nr:TlpA disulfide reductase family protein [Chitinophaga rhizosphaerae]
MNAFVVILAMLAGSAVERVSPAEVQARLAAADSPMVVNLWATWCVPCVEELPHFEKAAKANPGVKFVYLSLDLEEAWPREIDSFVNRIGLSGEVWWMAESNANKFASLIDASWKGSLPATLFIHPGKKYRKFVQGAMDEGAVMREVEVIAD